MSEIAQAGAAVGVRRHALDEALSQVGDRWSLLIVNSLLSGPLRFKELEGSLEGIATNVLAQRLKTLERRGLIVATAYSERPPRFSYALTSAGQELAGAVRVLSQWGAERSGTTVASTSHAECGTALEARWYCPTCGRVVDEGENRGPAFI